MNSFLSMALVSFGMSSYQKYMKTQNIEVKYANQYRLRLQSSRWKNSSVVNEIIKSYEGSKFVKTVSGHYQIGTLTFNFYKAELEGEEFQAFMEGLVQKTDTAYKTAPITALNRLYDGKKVLDGALKQSTYGFVDTDTIIFGLALMKGIKMFSKSPQTALGFLWWSYTILDRANKRR
jgi:hypothetical protein